MAVILVVLFHAKTPFLPGGFVGVDVFLVISGFLITRLLLDQLDTTGLRIGAFYYRRVRRLVPALVVMVSVLLPAAFFLLGQHDLELTAAASLAALAFVSNLFFWGKTSYFTAQRPEPPLLHTWSLGLEEQFYLLFPAFLWFIRPLGKNYRPIAFAAGTIALFAFTVWLTAGHPGTAFYLLPARAWEFLLGGTICMLTGHYVARALLREFLVATGLVGLIIAALCITPATPYPGVAVFLPAVSTGSILWGNARGTRVGRLLESPAITTIGAASYSLYLWHWPVLTFARYYLTRDLSVTETITALCATALLAATSWLCVEQPFRVGSARASSPRSLTIIGALTCVAALLAAAALLGRGFPGRFPPTSLAFERQGLEHVTQHFGCHHGPPELVDVADLCVLSRPTAVHRRILLWGDSHANAIAPAMATLGMANHDQVWQASYSSCPPLLGVHIAHRPKSDHCEAFNETAFRAIVELRIQSVVLAAYWTIYTPDRANSVLVRALDPFTRSDEILGGGPAENLQSLRRALVATVTRLARSGIDVWIVKQIPAQDGYVPLVLSRAALRGQNYSALGIPRDEYLRSQLQVDQIFAELAVPVHLVDPSAILCQTGRCLMSSGSRALYLDSNHLSVAGAELIEPALEPIFEETRR